MDAFNCAGHYTGSTGRWAVCCARLAVVALAAIALNGCEGAPDCVAAQVTQVSDGVWVRGGHNGIIYQDENLANIGFVVGEQCVAVIDTGGSKAEGEALNCAIRQITDTPVCFVLTTHVHPDHMLGSLAFAAPLEGQQVEFIGHHKLPRALATRGDVYLQRAAEAAGAILDPDNIVLPTRLIKGAETLDLGGRQLQLTAHTSAHTDHDLSVFDPHTGTLWLSDMLFVNHTPVIDSSINGWIAQLEALTNKSVAHVIPGHGPTNLSWPAAAEPNLRYLRELRRELRQWIADGRDMGAAQDQVGYSHAPDWELFDEYHRRNIATAFLELEWE